jgi:monoamine oxidase
VGALFFAGEAYDTLWPTYLPGAYETGKKAAHEALEKMKKQGSTGSP